MIDRLSNLFQEMKQVTLSNGETYAYRTEGNAKEVMLLLHGNFSSSYYFKTVMPMFSKNFKVIAPDLRGYGHSSWNKPQESIDDLAEDVKLFVDQLKLEKFTLLGWSLGGGVAMKFAAKYPDYIDKLILLHSVGGRGIPFYLDTDKNEDKIRAKTLEEVSSISAVAETDQALKSQDKEKIKSMIMNKFFTGSKKPSEEKVEEFAKESLLQKSYSRAAYMLNAFNISNDDNGVTQGTNEIEGIQCETLLLYGSKDERCPPEEGALLFKWIGDNAQFRVFEDCGHFVFEDYPEESVDLITRYVLGKF